MGYKENCITSVTYRRCMAERIELYHLTSIFATTWNTDYLSIDLSEVDWQRAAATSNQAGFPVGQFRSTEILDPTIMLSQSAIGQTIWPF